MFSHHAPRSRPVRHLATPALGILALATQVASGDGISGVAFVDGSALVNGSASSPAGSSSATAPGVVTPSSVTGGGSTGSGLVSAALDLDGAVILGSQESFVTMDGYVQASQPAGYPGFANLNFSFNTPSFESDPLILSIPSSAFFKITNQGSQSVTFTAVTGSIRGSTLTAGTYRIGFSFGAAIGEGQTFVEKTLDWTLRLSTEPLTNLPTDLNTDGHVDAMDLAMLLASWGSAGADVSGNGVTAAEDLALLLADWG